MARPGPQTFAKRQREIAKQEKRRAKAEKMALRRAKKKDGLPWTDTGAADGGGASGSEENSA